MAATTAQEIIVLKSPSLAGDTRLDDFVELATLTVSERIFKDRYQYALALVVLHQITLDAQSGGGENSSGSGISGGVNSEKEGDLSIGYGNAVRPDVSANDAYWASTIFGQEYVSLRRSFLMLPRTRLTTD